MPELLDKDWEDYFQRFVTHYALDPTKQEVARKVLDDEKARTVRWLLTHLIQETARHAGHMDILRELADGARGE